MISNIPIRCVEAPSCRNRGKMCKLGLFVDFEGGYRIGYREYRQWYFRIIKHTNDPTELEWYRDNWEDIREAWK